uniref:Uncharacterized protein n=1 Tax=Heterosigma akashiwo TaxID=2829 RepID=A0A7S4D763_HETAK
MKSEDDIDSTGFMSFFFLLSQPTPFARSIISSISFQTSALASSSVPELDTLWRQAAARCSTRGSSGALPAPVAAAARAIQARVVCSTSIAVRGGSALRRPRPPRKREKREERREGLCLAAFFDSFISVTEGAAGCLNIRSSLSFASATLRNLFAAPELFWLAGCLSGDAILSGSAAATAAATAAAI